MKKSKTSKTTKKKKRIIKKVLVLVPKGLLSPTIIMHEILGIKSWQTARRYTQLTNEEPQEYILQLTLKTEYRSMIPHLYYLRGKLLKPLESNSSLNQIMEIAGQVPIINELLINLLNLSKHMARTYLLTDIEKHNSVVLPHLK